MSHPSHSTRVGFGLGTRHRRVLVRAHVLRTGGDRRIERLRFGKSCTCASLLSSPLFSLLPHPLLEGRLGLSWLWKRD